MYKKPEEIQLIREGASILSKVHGEVAKRLKPGVSGTELNKVAEETIATYGAQPSFKGLDGFPAAICFSVNDQVVHGIPTHYILQEGDIVTIDCGVYYKGFHSDAAFTHIVGVVAKELLHLLAVTKEAMYKGIEVFRLGNTLGDVGNVIQSYVEGNGLCIVEKYSGHGVGRQLHEEPIVPNFGRRGKGIMIEEGMVVAIEPIVTINSPEVHQRGKWIVATKDGTPACHFEHTVALVDGKPEILTTYAYIEKQNKIND